MLKRIIKRLLLFIALFLGGVGIYLLIADPAALQQQLNQLSQQDLQSYWTSVYAWIAENATVTGIIVSTASALFGFLALFQKSPALIESGRDTHITINQNRTHCSQEIDTDKLAESLLRKTDQRYAEKEQQIKSLKQALADFKQAAQTAKDDQKERFSQAFDALARGDTKKAETLFETIAHEKEQKIKADQQDAARAYRNLGAIAFLHDTHKALAAYQKATELDPDDAEGWNQLGHLYDRIGELEQAQRTYKRVLQLGEDSDDQVLIAVATGNLGTIYKTRGELDKAEDYFNKSLAIETALNRKEGMANQYGNLGLIYKTRGELDKAEEAHSTALEINKALNRKVGLAIQYGNLGLIYQTRGELDKAEEAHSTALEINKALNRKEGMASDYANLGLLHEDRGDLDKTRNSWQISYQLFTELSSPNAEQVKGWLDDLDKETAP